MPAPKVLIPSFEEKEVFDEYKPQTSEILQEIQEKSNRSLYEKTYWKYENFKPSKPQLKSIPTYTPNVMTSEYSGLETVMNPSSIDEIATKGYSVYEYLAIDELKATFERDFLGFAIKFWKPIIIALWVIGFLFYSMWAAGIFGFINLVFFLYLLLFGVLFFKLLARTKLFLMIKDVVYTDTHLVLWNAIYDYKNIWSLKNLLDSYEWVFDERLNQPSKIFAKIEQYRKDVWSMVWSSFWDVGDFIWDSMSDSWWRTSREAANAWAIIMLAMGLVSLIGWALFWLGLMISKIFLNIYGAILSWWISRNPTTEWKIYKDINSIEKDIDQMSKAQKNIATSIQDFQAEKILTTFDDRIDSNMKWFYTLAQNVMKQKNILSEYIAKTKYSEIFNFKKFNNYYKTSFNQPIFDMIAMLTRAQKVIAGWNQIILENDPNSEFKGHLDQKQIELAELNRNIEAMKQKLEWMII